MKKLVVGMLLVLTGLFASNTMAQKAVNFAFIDIHNKTIRLTDYRGKWVLINFWASWCPRCSSEVPILEELNRRKDFVVIGIAMDYANNPQDIYNFIAAHNMNYSQVLGGDRHSSSLDTPMNQIGPVDFYPVSYLYTPKGELIMYIPGSVDKQRLLAFISEYRG